MAGQAEIHDLFYGRVLFQILGYGHGIFLMCFHAHGQSLDSAQYKKTIKRSGHGADSVLVKFEGLVEVIARSDDRTTDDITVATQIFCHRMHHDIGTEGKGCLQIGAGKSIVDNRDQPLGLAHGGYRFDVAKPEQGIGWCLPPI